ncbi:unnamed protein product, partial [Effrenium voratum]
VVDGQAQVEDIRPITVMSVWWRVWASAVVVAGVGPRSEGQVAAAEAFRAIALDGYGCTLDYAKAYDLMNPECTVRLMVCGLKHVQERVPPEQAGTDKDRSFSAPTPGGLLRKKEIWAEWSQRVGLRESEGKAQFFTSNGQTASQLRARVPEPQRVSHSGDILGCAVAFVGRSPSPKELARVDAAKRVTLLLGAIRVTWARFHLLVRLFAISKACYGWISRLPTLAICQGIWSAIRAGHNTLLVANKDLRAMVVGGHCHLDIVAAIQ